MTDPNDYALIDPFTQDVFAPEKSIRNIYTNAVTDILVPVVASREWGFDNTNFGVGVDSEGLDFTFVARINYSNKYYPYEYCIKIKSSIKTKFKMTVTTVEYGTCEYRVTAPNIQGSRISKFYTGYDITFTRADSVPGQFDYERDTILPELTLARGESEPIFNATLSNFSLQNVTVPDFVWNTSWPLYNQTGWNAIDQNWHLGFSTSLTLVDKVFSDTEGFKSINSFLHVKKLYITFAGDSIGVEVFVNNISIGSAISSTPGVNTEYIFSCDLNNIKLEELKFLEIADSGCDITSITVESYGELWYEHWAAHSPYNTEWAFEGMKQNPSGEEFHINNIQNLYFIPFTRALDSYVGDNIVGRNAICHIMSTDTYIDFNFFHWESGGGGGFGYTRADTSVPPIERSIPERSIPDGWMIFNRPNNVDGTLPQYQDQIIPGVLGFARGTDQGIYNSEIDTFDADGNPADTEWAFANENANPAANDPSFTIENANNLFFDDTLNNYPISTQVGNLGIVRVPSINKYFYLKFLHYDLKLSDYNVNVLPTGGFQYIRTLPIDGPLPYVNPATTIFQAFGECIIGLFDISPTLFLLVITDLNSNIILLNFTKLDYTQNGWSTALPVGRSINTEWYSSIDIGYGGIALAVEMDNHTLGTFNATASSSSFGTTVIPRGFYGIIAASANNVFVTNGSQQLVKLDTDGNTVSTSLTFGFDPYKIMVANSGAIFVCGQMTGTGMSISKINPTMTIAWTYTHPGPNWAGRDIPMAYNELSGSLGVLYVSDYYNERIVCVNTGTGALLKVINYTELGDMSVSQIFAMAADVDGVYVLIGTNDNYSIKFVSLDSLTINTIDAIQETNQYNSSYRWIFLNGNDIILASTGDTENGIDAKLISIPRA